MKYIGKKSLSSTLAAVITFIWWAEWIFASYSVYMALVAAKVRRGYALQVPVSFEPISIRQIRSSANYNDFSIMNTTNGTISIHIQATWQNMALMLLGYGALFAVIVIITYQVKKIFSSLKRDEPFQILNLLRIRRIALTLIAYSVVQFLFVIITNKILLSMFTFKHLDLTYDFDARCLMIGIIMLVLKGIFKTGVALEEEKQLTI